MTHQSLIAQGSEYPLKKPAAFHWDFFILGITTFIAGLLGIPAPNGELSFGWEFLLLVKRTIACRSYSSSTPTHSFISHYGPRGRL